MNICIDSQNEIVCTTTPWNDEAVGGKSCEIESFVFSDENRLKELLNTLNQQVSHKNIKFLSTRISSNNQVLRKALVKNGFYFAEHSFRIQFNLQSNNANLWKPYSQKKLIYLSKISELEQVKNIARNNFFHGRFHEDPFISQDFASKRNMRWVESASTQGLEFLLYKIEEEVIAFLMLSAQEKSVEIYFGGSKKQSTTTPKLIASGLEFYRNKNYNKFLFNISASNLKMVNIVVRIGGKVIDSLFGYHKAYEG